MSIQPELRAQLERALGTLHGTTRAVFLLHRLDDFDYAGIAHRLGISTSEVERRLADALVHLARELDRAEQRRRK